MRGPRGTGHGHDLMRGWLTRSGIRLVPQAELQTYSADLRSLTGDRGAFSVKPHGYQDVPEHLARKVMAERQAALRSEA